MINWLLLSIQLLVLLSLFLAHRSNLPLLLLVSTSILLVQFQAVYILASLAARHSVSYIGKLGPYSQTISREGFTIANVTLTLSVLLIHATYRITCRKTLPEKHRPLAKALKETAGSYVTVMAVVCGASYFLARLMGGFAAVLYKLGVMVGGQTLLVILISIGKMPLLHKSAFARRAIVLDVLLFVATVLLTLLNSRFLALCAIGQLAIVRYYCKGRAARTFSAPRLLMLGGVAFVILIVYGSIRDYIGRERAYSALRLAQYYEGSSTGEAFDAARFFFTRNVEAFSGFAGIVSTWRRKGIQHDAGLSALGLVMHLMPYSVRTGAFAAPSRVIDRLYPYRVTIVSGGYETSFAAFGFAGVIAFSLCLGFLPGWIDRKLRNPSTDKLKYGIVAIQVATLVRGGVSGAAFFALADLAMLTLYRLILFMFARASAPCKPSC